MAHEIGHNFGSYHTHCYEGIGGNALAIDPCNSSQCGRLASCFCGTAGLPLGCPGFGQGCGTIMSYCQQQPGGTDNIALTLGASHPYGIQPERVPAYMLGVLAQRAVDYPGCLENCEGSSIVFAETILVNELGRLTWPTPSDVAYVRGDLIDVSSLAVLETTGSLDVDLIELLDVPSVGSGFYYLVRPLICGSWQTSPGAERDRDDSLR